MHGREREWILSELARREVGESGQPLRDVDEATIQSLQAELETLVGKLREPPPVDDYAEESACRRATEMVEQLAHPSAPIAEPAALERIGPYQVLARLPQGGMGTVYRAVHPKLKRVVAIKVLPASRTSDADAVARFEREMEAVGRLRHRHIVAATDAGEIDGMHYLVMEYVDGLDLSALVRRVGPLAPADACEIIRQAALGVQEAHERGIIHRDIKPSNLILAEGGYDGSQPVVKVLDFGLARLGQPTTDQAELTYSGQIMGTLKYMAPEQCASSRNVDQRADIYSLGATLYRLLSGEAPFSSKEFDSPLTMMSAVTNEQPVRLSSRRGDLPPMLCTIVETMMAKNPADRFATTDEVIEALTPWAEGADLAAVLERARAADLTTETPPRGADPSMRPSSAAKVGAHRKVRSPFSSRMIFLGILGLITAAAAAYVSLQFRNARVDGVARDAEHSARAARWLSAMNGRFGVVTNQGMHVLVAAGDAIPSEPFQLTSVDLSRQQKVRDDDLARFRGLTRLDTVSFSYTGVGDDGLLRLGDLPELKHLFLVETPLTDRGLVALGRFPKLVTLFLSGTRITDAGLKHVGACQRLNELMLVGCDVTDGGLAELHGLTNLKSLNLQNTKVTFDGVAELEAALPSCSIQSNFSRPPRTARAKN